MNPGSYSPGNGVRTLPYLLYGLLLLGCAGASSLAASMMAAVVLPALGWDAFRSVVAATFAVAGPVTVLGGLLCAVPWRFGRPFGPRHAEVWGDTARRCRLWHGSPARVGVAS